jgi:hypothetical protein
MVQHLFFLKLNFYVESPMKLMLNPRCSQSWWISLGRSSWNRAHRRCADAWCLTRGYTVQIYWNIFMHYINIMECIYEWFTVHDYGWNIFMNDIYEWLMNGPNRKPCFCQATFDQLLRGNPKVHWSMVMFLGCFLLVYNVVNPTISLHILMNGLIR